MGLPGVLRVVEAAPKQYVRKPPKGRLSRGRRSVGLGDPAGLRVPSVRKGELPLQTNRLELVALDDVRRRSALVQNDPFESEPTKSFLKLLLRHDQSIAARLRLGQGAGWRLRGAVNRPSSA
jgi:hypothetical protein